MTKKEKLERKRIVRDYQSYHEPLISASRYVKQQTGDMFPEIYMNITEHWGTFDGFAIVYVVVMWKGEMHRSKARVFMKREFDDLYKRRDHPAIYCRSALAADVFNLYANLVLKEGSWR